jgi:uncharacterized Fe-S cluster-containing radical SAM superfamily protein
VLYRHNVATRIVDAMSRAYFVPKLVMQVRIVLADRYVIVENVERNVIRAHVRRDNYVKMVLVWPVVGRISIVATIDRASTVNVWIHVNVIMLAVRMRFVKLLIIEFFVSVRTAIKGSRRKSVRPSNANRTMIVKMIRDVLKVRAEIHA